LLMLSARSCGVSPDPSRFKSSLTVAGPSIRLSPGSCHRVIDRAYLGTSFPLYLISMQRTVHRYDV
jgi:hypothetical protein